MHKCGGHDAGMHRFLPHCTLLYNTSFPSEYCREHEQNVQRRRRRMQKQDGEELLSKCLTEYYNERAIECCCSDTPSNFQLIPTSHYYFPYPKTADNGKGFGCVISLLILQTTPELQLLHEVVKKMFPPDERHHNTDDASSSNNNNNTCDTSFMHKHGGNGCFRKEEEAPSFRPHMALIYAPENHENVTNGWLEKYTTQMESKKWYLQWAINKHDDYAHVEKKATNRMSDSSKASAWDAKYLSIWCTEGTLDEWYPIAKLDLLHPKNHI